MHTRHWCQHARTRNASCPQPAAPLQLSGTAASIATLTWQIAVKENMMDKVQEELQQVRGRVRMRANVAACCSCPRAPSPAPRPAAALPCPAAG